MLSALVAIALAPPLLFSRAKVEITPPEPLPLGGYTERGSRVFEPIGPDQPATLFARTLILRRGDFRLAIVSVDMLTVPESLAREVRARVPRDIDLFLSATHTHSAPDSQMLNDRMTFPVPGIASFRRRWLEWYADRIASSVSEALRSAPSPADACQIVRFTADANRGRRLGALPDQTLSVVFLTSDGGERGTCAFVHYAAHPILKGPENMRTDPDWPGSVAAFLDALVLNGAIGDVSPVGEGETGDGRVRDFLDRLGLFEREWKTEPLWTSAGSLAVLSESISLDPKSPHPSFAQRYRVPQTLAETAVRQFAPEAASVTAFRIGKLAVVGIPGEPTSHLGRRIRDAGRRIGFGAVLVVSHVNGWMGYILGARDYDAGGYEPTLSFYGRQQGEKVVASAIKALKRLASGVQATPARPKPGTRVSRSSP